MNFEVGRLSASLTLDGVQEFHRGLDDAGRKLNDTAQRGSSFGRLGSEAFRQVAGATTGLVTAAGAYLAILTKTGIAYNSLQQNSRAALKVLLGGTEQANAQMDKLDAFARNSPFSKSVFIQAQQQLIGFGMEAGKVIPALDAIQQGVAAMGGSNEQITEVVNILAKVQSTGKFTAETLNELGYRGVDAATLMGDAMGKSAAQIRDDISKAAIGGSEAIDILVGAMQDRFGGAADGVKEQWSGAVDRIKAAQRDLGAVIAEPFVSAQGGGMAVTWGNQVADVLRAIEKQAVPVMGILTQRGMPFFASLTQGLDSARASIQRWDASSLEVSLDKLAGHAPGIAALTGVVLALGTQVGPLASVFSVLNISANPVLAAFIGLAAASPELRDALGGLLAAGKPLLPLVGDLAQVLSGSLNSALPLVSNGVEVLTGVLTPVLGVLAQIPAPVLAGAAAFLVLQRGLKIAEGPLSTVIGLLQQFGQRAAVQAALGETSRGVGMIATASIGAQGAVKGLGTAMKGAFLSNPIGIALTAVSTLVGAWAVANAAAQQKVEEHKNRVASLKDTLNETTGALTEASEAQVKANLAETEAKDLADKIGVSYRDVEQAVLGNGEAYARVTAAVNKYSASMTTGDANLDTWNATFMDGQASVKSFTEILDEHRSSVEDAQTAKREAIQADREAAAAMSDAARSNQRFNEALQVARDITQDAETRVRALKQALDELQGGQIGAEEAAKRLSETNLTLAEGLAQTDEAGSKLWQSTLDGAGAIDVNSRAGLAFADTMGQARDRMLDAAMAAADQKLAHNDVEGAIKAATDAGNGYIETLRQTMSEADLTEAQIDGLIGTYLDVPDVVATVLTDDGTADETTKRVLQLQAQILATPDKTIIIDEPQSPEVMKRLEALGMKVTRLPGGLIRITQTGAAEVENTLANLVRHRVAEIGVRYTGGGGTMTKADGGVVGHLSGRTVDMRSFANGGGFPTGIFAGGPPLIKFAEPETGWEAFISGRKGQEARNARIAMDALDRLGFPVIPVAALRGVPAFANGGTVSTRPLPSPSAQPVQVQRRERRRGRRGPLADTINVGVDASTNDLRTLADVLDRLDREG